MVSHQTVLPGGVTIWEKPRVQYRILLGLNWAQGVSLYCERPEPLGPFLNWLPSPTTCLITHLLTVSLASMCRTTHIICASLRHTNSLPIPSLPLLVETNYEPLHMILHLCPCWQLMFLTFFFLTISFRSFRKTFHTTRLPAGQKQCEICFQKHSIYVTADAVETPFCGSWKSA